VGERTGYEIQSGENNLSQLSTEESRNHRALDLSDPDEHRFSETTISVAHLWKIRREIREGLAMIINGDAGVPMARAVYRSMEEALERIARRSFPHVVLNDVGLPRYGRHRRDFES